MSETPTVHVPVRPKLSDGSQPLAATDFPAMQATLELLRLDLAQMKPSSGGTFTEFHFAGCVFVIHSGCDWTYLIECIGWGPVKKAIEAELAFRRRVGRSQ